MARETIETPQPGISAAGATPRRILIVDDNETTCKQLQELLQADGLVVDYRRSGADAVEALSEANYSIVLTDMQMPGMNGIELLQQIQKGGFGATVIVLTGHGSVEEAVKALRLGAYDFLTKPVDTEHMRLVVARVLRERALQDELVAVRMDLNRQYSFQNILSKHPKMHAIFELISNLGHTNSTVLIEGETGTGKEQVARAVHAAAAHRSGPFVAVNCAALPETLLESELFGHEKGAFTSAVGQRQGRFEMAEGGTLFLDEAGDVPATMQAKLLRVLQERSFERVGGTQTIHVDVRVVAASNRSLPKLVKEGKFREDLFYRLNVVKIDLPPLRERAVDIPLLAAHFTLKYARRGECKQISPAAMEVLLNYSWPGNIRELENVIERACVTSRDQEIGVNNLPPELLTPQKPTLPVMIDLAKPLSEHLDTAVAQLEHAYLRKALEHTNGHIGACARICGLSRRSITVKMAQYQLNKTAFKPNLRNPLRMPKEAMAVDA